MVNEMRAWTIQEEHIAEPMSKAKISSPGGPIRGARSIAAAIVAAVLIAGAAAAVAQAAEHGRIGQRTGELRPVAAWYEGEKTYYWDFGVSVPNTADLYRAISGFSESGGPIFVEGQDPVVDTVPGDPGYSDFWRIIFYVVDGDFVPGSARSVAAVRDAGHRIIDPEITVNCPIVDAGARANERVLNPGWHVGRQIVYFDFGRDQIRAGTSNANIYVFVDGFDVDGSPRISGGATPILDARTGDSIYSALRRVNYVVAPGDLEAGGLRSAAAILDSGLEIRPTDIFMNLPAATVTNDGLPVWAWWTIPSVFLVLAAGLFYRALIWNRRRPYRGAA